MTYNDAKEFYSLVNTDPSMYFQDQKVIEAFDTIDTFTSLKNMIDETPETNHVVTEAFETASAALQSLSAWFSKIFRRFQAMVRSISFKRAEKKLEKAQKKDLNINVTISDSDVEDIQKLMNELNISGSVNSSMKASDLASLTKSVIDAGNRVNNALKKGFDNLQVARAPQNVKIANKSWNDEARKCVRLMKMCMRILNSAIKEGVVTANSGYKYTPMLTA